MLVAVHMACLQEEMIDTDTKNISLVASATHKTRNSPALGLTTQAEGIPAKAAMPSATRDLTILHYRR